MNNTTTIKNINTFNNEYISFDISYVFMSLIKLSLSLLFSFIIGFERELHTHPGGICTHTLVGLGSCLFTMISVHLKDKYDTNTSDPGRICAQIVSGMGFLGSATIYKSDNYVKGINTAANLWISAAISMAIGADLWELGAITSAFSLFVLLINNRYKKYVYKIKKNNNLNETLSHDPLDAPYGDEEMLEMKID
jgi:putative Mg2+ transporter-C (MgtC) family protein